MRALQVLKAIETFMNEHYTSGFSKLEVEIAKLALKSGKRAPNADPLLDGGGAAAKRPRVSLSGLMGAHIDTYLSEYTIYSGNKERRGGSSTPPSSRLRRTSRRSRRRWPSGATGPRRSSRTACTTR